MNVNRVVDKVVDELVSTPSQKTIALHAPHCNWCMTCPECRSRVVQCMADNGACRVGAGPNLGPIQADFAKLIDHTLLKADATKEQIVKLCDEAKQYNFASVCINPGWVKLCRDLLRSSDVQVCTVIGFPLGATSKEAKAFEAEKAIEQGADEIDMVINVGKLKSGEYDCVQNDIEAVVGASTPRALVKVIIETCYLTDEEKIKACLLSREAGAAYVKTSTGFGPKGATLADVALMKKVVGSRLGVKASGGIRDYESAVKMVDAGATRIGASASIAMVNA